MEKRASLQDIQVREVAAVPTDRQPAKMSKMQVVAAAATTSSKPNPKTQAKLAASLLAAAAEGKVDLVRLLLRSGADPNARQEQTGNTALHLAAWNGFSETVQVLCKYRAHTSSKNKVQFTPLHLACQQGHNQSARLLLMAQARTEAKNSYGDTPLHTAARYGHAGVARILLSAKCEPNQVNKNHDTPLHIAAAMGRRKLTKIFMQNGAEPAIKNKQYETAMDIALRKDLVDIQELITNPPPARRARKPAGRRRRRRARARDQSSADEEPEEEEEQQQGEGAGPRGELAVDVPAKLARNQRLVRPQRATLNGAHSDLHLLASVLARQRLAEARRADSADGACPLAGGPQRASPAGSLRSSLSRSRGRLLVRRRLGRRRPNLGTCVGKLSLLRLRGAPDRRTQAAASTEEQAPAGGRRLERQRLQQARAPNGARLLATRPLAPLGDETQLYAIPKKSKSKQQVASDQPAAEEAAQAPASEPSAVRVASGGPALTSDGGHTSSGSADCSSSSSGSLARSSEKEAAAEGKRPALVGVHADADLYSPGYSVVGARRPLVAGAPDQACRCRAPAADGPATGGPRASEPPAAAAAASDKAESSVARAPSRLRQLLHLDGQRAGRHAQAPAEPARQQPEPRAARKSWLMSKFSLSAGNLAAKSSAGAADHEVQQVDASCKRVQVVVAATEAAAAAEPQPAADEEKKPDQEHQLVRPKSALSATSADLIAAQKSLAAAAAAKVRRDRLLKCGEPPEPPANQQTPTILTVKTSEPADFWLDHPLHLRQVHLHHHLQAGGNPQGANEHKFGPGAPRSGTNSAGMSDSSPSNNGADSDNSIQTTTGSLHTDNTSGGQPTSDRASATSAGPSPLGILSRILLNNKSLADSASSSGSSTTLRQAMAAAAAAGDKQQSDAKPQHQASSLSSALSSPCSANNRSSSVAAAEHNNTKLLDQLASRSRQPIVLTKSNELTADHQEQEQPAADEESAPRLPPKSALRQAPLQMQVSPDQMVNGLPRVASYGHLSQPDAYRHLDALYLNQKPANEQNHLCNYHALSQRTSFVHHQPYQPPYLPYSPFDLQLTSTGGRPELDPSKRLDLNSALASNSAINYEYYLDPVGHYGARYPTAYDLSAYKPRDGYLRDDPPYLSSSKQSNMMTHQRMRDNYLPHNGTHYADLIHTPPQRPVRPKSSNDTYLLSSVRNSHLDADHLDRRPDGHLRLTCATSNNNSHRQQQSAIDGYNKPVAPIADYYANSAYLDHQYSNSIYADDQGAKNFHQSSDLTVLPPTTTITSNGDTTTIAIASGQRAKL